MSLINAKYFNLFVLLICFLVIQESHGLSLKEVAPVKLLNRKVFNFSSYSHTIFYYCLIHLYYLFIRESLLPCSFVTFLISIIHEVVEREKGGGVAI